MSAATNVVRRPGSVNYYARMAIPKDLQARLSGRVGKLKREFWKSLETTDPREAKRRARPVLDAWEREIDEHRRPRQFSEDELRDAVWKRYVELITTDEKFRQACPTAADLDAIWNHMEGEFGGVYELDAFRILEMLRDQFDVDQRERAARFVTLKADVAKGETRAVADVVRKVIDERRLDLDMHSLEYKRLANGIQRAELEYLKRAEERDAADFSGKPTDPLVQQPTTMAHKPGEKILELFDRFHREAPAGISTDTWDQNRKIVVLFDQFLGGNAHISLLTRANVRDWKAKLFLWPTRAADTGHFKGLTFLKVVEKNEIVRRQTITDVTVNRYISALGAFCKWLLSNDYVTTDVMAGLFLKLDRRKQTRFPHSEENLQKIFASPLFHTCGGDKLEHEAGNVAIRDWRYWIPWIGLYTGARLGEIAQLLTKDVRQLHGQWIFHITREGSTRKSVKNAGSERVVPVHPELIKLGLLDYIARMQAINEANLFPELEPDGRGFISGVPSSFFNQYFRDIGVKVDKTVNFHSFRHGFADALRTAGYLDEQFNMLLGHTKATTTGRYGIMPEGILSERVKMIEAVNFAILKL